MSIGIAQNAPTVNSAKKNARLSDSTMIVRSCTISTGTMNTVDIRKPKTMMLRRAFVRLCVRSKMRSLTTPPRKSPHVPPRKTPDAKSAELLNFRL